MTKTNPLLYIQLIVKCIFNHVHTGSTQFFSSRPIYPSAEFYWLILANHRYIDICILVGRCVFFLNVFLIYFFVCVQVDVTAAEEGLQKEAAAVRCL